MTSSKGEAKPNTNMAALPTTNVKDELKTMTPASINVDAQNAPDTPAKASPNDIATVSTGTVKAVTTDIEPQPGPSTETRDRHEPGALDAPSFAPSFTPKPEPEKAAASKRVAVSGTPPPVDKSDSVRKWLASTPNPSNSKPVPQSDEIAAKELEAPWKRTSADQKPWPTSPFPGVVPKQSVVKPLANQAEEPFDFSSPVQKPFTRMISFDASQRFIQDNADNGSKKKRPFKSVFGQQISSDSPPKVFSFGYSRADELVRTRTKPDAETEVDLSKQSGPQWDFSCLKGRTSEEKGCFSLFDLKLGDDTATLKNPPGLFKHYRSENTSKTVPTFPLFGPTPERKVSPLFGPRPSLPAMESKLQFAKPIISKSPTATKPIDSSTVVLGNKKCERGSPDSYAASGIVTVSVGYDKRQFHIHKDILLSESDTIQSKLLEPLSGIRATCELLLPLIPGRVFSILVNHFYHDYSTITGSKNIFGNGVMTGVDDIISAWSFASALDMEDAQNAIMDSFRETTFNWKILTSEGHTDPTANILSQSITRIQQGVLSDKRSGPLYEFFLDRIAYEFLTHQSLCIVPGTQRFIYSMQQVVKQGGEIMADLMARIITMKSSVSDGRMTDPAGASGCLYHVHTPRTSSRVCSEQRTCVQRAADAEKLAAGHKKTQQSAAVPAKMTPRARDAVRMTADACSPRSNIAFRTPAIAQTAAALGNKGMFARSWKSLGTTAMRFTPQPTVEPVVGGFDRVCYQSITMNSCYQDHSFEELRLADYRNSQIKFPQQGFCPTYQPWEDGSLTNEYTRS